MRPVAFTNAEQHHAGEPVYVNPDAVVWFSPIKLAGHVPNTTRNATHIIMGMGLYVQVKETCEVVAAALAKDA